MIDAIKADNSKLIIVTVVPGVIATFPFAATFIVLFIQKDSLKDLTLVISTVSFLISIAVGLILENIGSIIEIVLAALFAKRLKSSKPTTIPSKETYTSRNNTVTFYEYNKVWDYYLFSNYKKDDTEIIYRYYHSIITRLKFELSMIPTILLMVGGLYFMDRNLQIVSILPNFWAWTISFSVLLLIGFIYFSYDSVRYVHKLRFKIVSLIELPYMSPIG